MNAHQRRLEKLGIDSSNRLFEVMTVACQKQNLEPDEAQFIRTISDNMILMSGKSFRTDTPSSARCAFVLANRQRIQDVYKGLSTKLQLSPKDLEDLNKADIASKPIMIRTMLGIRNIGYTKILVATILAAASLFALYVSGGLIYNMYAAVSGIYHVATMPLTTLYSLITSGSFFTSIGTMLLFWGVDVANSNYGPFKMAQALQTATGIVYRGVKDLLGLTLKGAYQLVKYGLYTIYDVGSAAWSEARGVVSDTGAYLGRNPIGERPPDLFSAPGLPTSTRTNLPHGRFHKRDQIPTDTLQPLVKRDITKDRAPKPQLPIPPTVEESGREYKDERFEHDFKSRESKDDPSS